MSLMRPFSHVSRSSHNRALSCNSPEINTTNENRHPNQNTDSNFKKLIHATYKRIRARLDKDESLTTAQKHKSIKKAINKLKRKQYECARQNFPHPLTRHHGNNRLKIATINPDCISDDRLRDIMNILEKNKIDFAGIQETHDTRDCAKKYTNYTYISSPAKTKTKQDGSETYAEAGVAFIIHNKWMEKLKQVKKYNERHIEITFNNLVITNTYAPDKSYSSIDRARYWSNLEENIFKVTDNNVTHIWTTDNNGQLGNGNKNPYIGAFARVKNNEKGNGQQLAAFMKKNKMRAANTFFYKHCVQTDKLATWTSPCGKRKKQLDYILINQHRANWVKNAYTLGPANRGNLYGHKIVIACLETTYKKLEANIKNKKIHNNFDIHKMRDNFEELEPIDADIFAKINWMPSTANPLNVSSNLRGPQLAGPLTTDNSNRTTATIEENSEPLQRINDVDINNAWKFITRKINCYMKENFKKEKKRPPKPSNLNNNELENVKELEKKRKSSQENEFDANNEDANKENLKKLKIAFLSLKTWKDLNRTHRIEDVYGNIVDISNNRTRRIKNAYIGVKINNTLYKDQVVQIHTPTLWNEYKNPKSTLEAIKARNRRKYLFKKYESDITNQINEIHRIANKRVYAEKLDDLNSKYLNGNTKPIWDFLKTIQRCNGDKKHFQELTMNDGTNTKNASENLTAWEEWITDNFATNDTAPKLPHISEEDLHSSYISDIIDNSDLGATPASDIAKEALSRENWNLIINDRKNSKLQRFRLEDDCGHAIYSSLSCPFSINEVKQAIRSLRRRKAFGPDRCPAEVLLRNEDIFSTFFQTAINQIFKRNLDLPASWTTAVLCMLHKKRKKMSEITTDPFVLYLSRIKSSP